APCESTGSSSARGDKASGSGHSRRRRPTERSRCRRRWARPWPLTWPASGDGLVFTNEAGRPVQQHPFAMVWARSRALVGLPSSATPHDLRHHYASILIRSGASVKVAQARLGHSSAKTTLDVYGHLFPDEEDRTRQAVDEAVRAARVSSPCHEDVVAR
ncbi:MAG: tyrosine-type recombinase/integrase, partial [Acidimicrobiia bacterium]|nr:tyrosine-type recombinase/integrase [Acidimicrobiia bacterium]